MRSRNKGLQARVVCLAKAENGLSVTRSEKWPMDLAKWGLLASLITAVSVAFRGPTWPDPAFLPSLSPPGEHSFQLPETTGSAWMCHLRPSRIVLPDGDEKPPWPIRPSLCSQRGNLFLL